MDWKSRYDSSTPTTYTTDWTSKSPTSGCHSDPVVAPGIRDVVLYTPLTEVLEFMPRSLDYLSSREVGYMSIRQAVESRYHSPSTTNSHVGAAMETDASHSFQKIELTSLADPPTHADSRLCSSPPPTLNHSSSMQLESARTRFISAVKSNRLDKVREAVLHSQVMIDDFRSIVYASIRGFDGIVSYFYALGDSLSVDEFHTVAKVGQNPTILKTILKHIDINAKNELGGCALFFSLVNHNYKMADYLLTASRDVEINPVDADGFRMTRAFLYLGDQGVVSWMISRGYRFDDAEDRPLETAILGMNPSVELVKLILEHSAREFAVLEARKVLKKLDSSELLTNPTIRNIFRLLKRYSYK